MSPVEELHRKYFAIIKDVLIIPEHISALQNAFELVKEQEKREYELAFIKGESNGKPDFTNSRDYFHRRFILGIIKE